MRGAIPPLPQYKPLWRKLPLPLSEVYEGVSKSFRTGRLERELRMVHLQLSRYFLSQSSEFCRHNPLCCFSTSAYYYCCLFRYRLSPETFE